MNAVRSWLLKIDIWVDVSRKRAQRIHASGSIAALSEVQYTPQGPNGPWNGNLGPFLNPNDAFQRYFGYKEIGGPQQRIWYIPQTQPGYVWLWDEQDSSWYQGGQFQPYERPDGAPDWEGTHNADVIPPLTVGRLTIANNYDALVTVRLYHPQGGGNVFGSKQLQPLQRLTWADEGGVVFLGSDWPIDIVFGNGVIGQRRLVGGIADFDGQEFEIVASRIFDG
ncbi:MAG: hypothetical protein U0930_24370 [Pirellulales bacterium]